MESKIDFSTVLASSVHDMKNSVGMLLSSVEGILDAYKPKSQEEASYFKTLHYEASRINGELIQLLTLYRMDNNFLPVSIDEHFVQDVFEDQCARNQLLIDTSEIQLSIDCDENLAWYFDADLIGGVIHNILLNCIRYTKNQIRLCAEIVNETLVISLADDGPGYPAEMIDNPGSQIEYAEVSHGATHMGLFFTQKIAELHKQGQRNGFIRLSNDSPLGGGLFQLYLP